MQAHREGDWASLSRSKTRRLPSSVKGRFLLSELMPCQMGRGSRPWRKSRHGPEMQTRQSRENESGERRSRFFGVDFLEVAYPRILNRPIFFVFRQVTIVWKNTVQAPFSTKARRKCFVFRNELLFDEIQKLGLENSTLLFY